MSRVVQVPGSASSHPTSYDSGYAAYSLKNPTRGYKDSGDTTNYSQLNLVRGEGAVSYLYYNFSFNIPSGATITAISCTVTCLINRTVATNITTRQIQLYAGSTAKGSASDVVNSTNLMTLDAGNASDWSASDVNNAKIRLYAVRGSVNTTNNYYFRFYGATLTVNYTYDKTQYEVTATSNVQGITVSSAQEWVDAGEDYDLDISGNISHAGVTDNDVDVTSSLVTIGTDEHRYSITNISADHTVLIFAVQVGDTIFIKVNGSWVEASDVYTKVNGSWKSVDSVYKKVSGSWQQQSDKSAMFDPSALYLKG